MAGLPARFGRYVLRELKAKGGMAEIFDADMVGQEGFTKRVALKRTLPHLSEQKSFVDMFLDEARLASKLSHPNVVQVFDFGEVEGRYFIAMEYLEGESLSAVVRAAKKAGTRLPVRVVLQIMAAAADGLHHAHAFVDNGRPLHIVHRDISPSNIMVTFQGGVKVLDFGIARAVDRQQEATETGIVKGKVPYCSPEQLRGDTVDARSDIFSLGIVLWELLAGQWLFRKAKELETLMSVLQGPVPLPSSLRPDVDGRLDAVVLKALERDVSKRYQTALELRNDLEALMEGPPVRLGEFLTSLLGPPPEARRPGELPTPHVELISAVDVPIHTGTGVVAPQPAQAPDRPPEAAPPAAPPASRSPLLLGVVGAGIAAVVVGSAVTWKVLSGAPGTSSPVVAEAQDAGAPDAVVIDAGAAAMAPAPEVEPDAGHGVAAIEVVRDAGAATPTPRPVAIRRPTPPTKPSAPGTLDVSCAPWCRIFIDGKDVGQVSPLVGYSLPAGKHRLRVEHPPSGRSAEKELVIEPGQALKETISLR